VGELALRFRRRKPSRVTIALLGRAQTLHLEEVCCYENLAIAVIVREGALGVDVRSKVAFFDSAFHASLFQRLSGCAFAAGKTWFDTSFGKRPLARAGLYQQKFKRRAANAIANGCYLDRKPRGGYLWKCPAGWLSQRVYPDCLPVTLLPRHAPMQGQPPHFIVF